MTAFTNNIGIPNISVYDLILQSPYSNDNQIALVDAVTGAEITYEKLFEQARLFGAGLFHMGVREGDMVMILTSNSINWVVCFLGILSIKAVPVPTNPNFTSYELKNVAALTKAKYWLSSPTALPKLLEALKDKPSSSQKFVLLEKDPLQNDQNTNTYLHTDSRIVTYQSLMQHHPCNVPTSSSSPQLMEETAVVLFSSGTTGLSKGVKLCHRNIVFMILTLSKGMYEPTFPNSLTPLPNLLNNKDVTLTFIPFFHIFGLVMSLIWPLFLRFKTIIFPRFDIEKVFSNIQRHKVSIICMSPSAMKIFVDNEVLKRQYDVSSFKTIVYGGDICPAKLDEDFKRLYNIKNLTQGYGSTEICLSALMVFPSFPQKNGSTGLLYPFTQVVVKCVKSGKEMKANEVGEICVKGPQVMTGYLNNEEATREVFDAQGFFHMGDVGYYDDEGYFFIVDRIKDLIKFQGFQISPSEIEILLKTHAGVLQAAVVGLSHPKFGEVPKAFVIKKEGCDVSKEELLNLVKVNLSGYKHLRGGVEFVSSLPMNASGKLRRKTLKEKANSKDLLISKM